MEELAAIVAKLLDVNHFLMLFSLMLVSTPPLRFLKLSQVMGQFAAIYPNPIRLVGYLLISRVQRHLHLPLLLLMLVYHLLQIEE